MDPTPEPSDELLARHGLTREEYTRAQAWLRRPFTLAELGVLGAMWSEHCSYKSSKNLLKLLPSSGPRVVQGPGENAGVVALDEEWVAVFKMESHNHPSFIEPDQGAATGVGGILRDVFAMGARPIALMNSLRFGRPEAPRMAHLIDGVVAGISRYGNAIGVPNVGGETWFEGCYDENILVNVFALGVAKRDGLMRSDGAQVGDLLVYFGAKTGRDGIHGATMASAQLDEQSEARRPTVQVGDPFQGKLAMEATLELIERGLVRAVQDMGAAGLTSSAVELANRSGCGARLDVRRVPSRDAGMSAYEFLLSESQERMLAAIDPAREQEVREVVERWEIAFACIGSMTDGELFEVFDGEQREVALPLPLLTSEAPCYQRPNRPRPVVSPPREVMKLPAPSMEEIEESITRLLQSPNLRSKRTLYERYDAHVGLGTLARSGEAAAAVMRVPGTSVRLALSVDCNARHVAMNPRVGAMRAVAEAARNVSCVGATPVALTDCLNFGDPTHPEVMWELREVIEGMSEACRALGTPVVSGNVSLYNATHDKDIFPTPTIAMVGIFEHDAPHVGLAFHHPGEVILMLGHDEPGGLAGSEWLRVMRDDDSEGCLLDTVNLEQEVALQSLIRALIKERIVCGAQDCTEGGMLIALIERLQASAPHLGVRLDLGEVTIERLFGERPSRIIASCKPEDVARLEALAAQRGVPCERLGEVRSEQAEEGVRGDESSSRFELLAARVRMSASGAAKDRT